MTTCLGREIHQILPLPKETAEEAARRKARQKKPRKCQRRFPTPLPRAQSTGKKIMKHNLEKYF